MQILGKRSKVLLIAISIVMLIAIGISFATWDSGAVKATSGDLSIYANAKVGDIVEFGRYYQTGNRINNDENAEYEKTPIEWLVVDKDERTGYLTLMSKYILAAGSYFGNYYYNAIGDPGYHYNKGKEELDKIPYNQAYVDSTARAYLNNLERKDLGGDSYSTAEGYRTSAILSDAIKEKLYTSIGFSNRVYTFTNEYKRPITNVEYKNKPATRGFYDEAFNNDEKALIVPKVIAGYTGFRWPNNSNNPQKMSYAESVVDKIWLPSATELNIMNAEDGFTNPSDAAGSTAFKYFINFNQYINPVTNTKNATLANAVKTERTDFVRNNSKAMNYSIPVYQYNSTTINDDISTSANSLDCFWTRSPMSRNYNYVRYVNASGSFHYAHTDSSNFGVRPCIILKY